MVLIQIEIYRYRDRSPAMRGPYAVTLGLDPGVQNQIGSIPYK